MSVDWEALKTEYVTTTTSYRKLADKYGISSVTLTNHGIAEKWVEARRQYKSKVMAKALSNAQARDMKKLSSLMTAADKLSKEIDGALCDKDQFRRHMLAVRKPSKATA